MVSVLFYLLFCWPQPDNNNKAMDKLEPNPEEEREEVLTDQILQLIIW